MCNDFANALKKTPKAVRLKISRNGRKHIGGYFEPTLSMQLRHLAIEEGTTLQSLLEEALNLLLESRGGGTAAKKPSR